MNLARSFFYVTANCHLAVLLALGAELCAQDLPPQVLEQLQRESKSLSARAEHDNYQQAAQYWYASRNPKHVPDMDQALEKVLPEALQQASFIKDFQSWETAQKFKAYHDAGAILLAKAYTYLYFGDIQKAESAVKMIDERFPFAMQLTDDRRYTWVRKALRYHEHCSMLYAAMSLKAVGKLYFPPERDEFDGMQQRKAIEHMTVLRLREGNVERLEHFFNAINDSGLQTSAGDWALDIVIKAIRPLDQDVQSTGAWEEIHSAIHHWQKRLPKSTFARLAEARYLYHYAVYKADQGESNILTVLRQSSERGLALLEEIPVQSPAWYDTKIHLMVINGCEPEEFALVYKEGVNQYPEYAPTIMTLANALADVNETGSQLAADFLARLVMNDRDQAAMAGQVLRRIYQKGNLQNIQPRLEPMVIEMALKAAFEKWPQSYELRSELGYMALRLGRRDLAEDIMKGMTGKWCRDIWYKREDIARELAKPATTTPTAQTSQI